MNLLYFGSEKFMRVLVATLLIGFSPLVLAWEPPEPNIPTDSFKYNCLVSLSEQVGSELHEGTFNFVATNSNLKRGRIDVTTTNEGWSTDSGKTLPTNLAGHQIAFNFGYQGVPRAKDRVFVWVRINKADVSSSAESFARYSTRETVESAPDLYTRADNSLIRLSVACESSVK